MTETAVAAVPENPVADVEEVLEKAGVSIAFRKKLEDGYALGLRIDPRASEAWHGFVRVATFRSAVMAAEVPDGAPAPYFLEISKVFYYDPKRDDTVWLWRVVMRGDIAPLVDLLTRQDFTPKKPRIEVTSFPLVGRIYGKPDSLKGIHPPDVATKYVAKAAIRREGE